MPQDFVSFVLTSATVSTVALAVLAFLLRGWITERLKNSIKHEYDRDIESYKSILSRIHAATAEGQKAAIERRMKAFDRVWKAMLTIRESTSPYNLYFDIQTEAEWRDLPSNPRFRSHIGTLNEDVSAFLGDTKIEEERPYIGEIVWAHFFAYRSFNIRLMYISMSALSRPELIDWRADAPMRGLLVATLSAAELAQLDTLVIAKIDFVRRTLEDKVLSAWHKLISGEEFGAEALRHANALLKVVSRA